MTDDGAQGRQSLQSWHVTPGVAAAQVGVSTQTIRNWLRSSKLRGYQDDQGRWQVELASLHGQRTKPARESGEPPVDDLRREIQQIAAAVNALKLSEATSLRLVDSLERERDRYRAEASAAREAALSLVAAAREVDGAVRQTLRVLELQAEALVQLLAPGSPGDLP
jgi:predicted DNA-binding protein (UPF0251 family)